jgi:hypothetical protein
VKFIVNHVGHPFDIVIPHGRPLKFLWCHLISRHPSNVILHHFCQPIYLHTTTPPNDVASSYPYLLLLPSSYRCGRSGFGAHKSLCVSSRFSDQCPHIHPQHHTGTPSLVLLPSTSDRMPPIKSPLPGESPNECFAPRHPASARFARHHHILVRR